MKEKINKTDVGIIVGRFMVHQLHDAHKDLIRSVKERHSRVIVFLGLPPLRNTINNPLEFRHRKPMIEEDFPDVEVHYIDDVRDDKMWSKNLDKQISKWLNPGQTCTLYGSRDSFINKYHGKFPTCELEPECYISGTEIRQQIINHYPSSKDFRAGIIAATGLRFPIAYQTVDVCIFNEDKSKFLLVKKPGENKWRFPGGFSDVKSDCLETDVFREAKEETNVEIGDIRYIGSCKIKDWRYEGEQDCIKTAMFVAKYIFGKPEGMDDVEFVRWTDTSVLCTTGTWISENIVEEHHSLVNMVIKWLIKTK